ncbi:MAG: hypothetical protein ACI9YB_000971 [Halioglobus sp.]|jgi:hypothetical protein
MSSIVTRHQEQLFELSQEPSRKRGREETEERYDGLKLTPEDIAKAMGVPQAESDTEEYLLEPSKKRVKPNESEETVQRYSRVRSGMLEAPIEMTRDKAIQLLMQERNEFIKELIEDGSIVLPEVEDAEMSEATDAKLTKKQANKILDIATTKSLKLSQQVNDFFSLFSTLGPKHRASKETILNFVFSYIEQMPDKVTENKYIEAANEHAQILFAENDELPEEVKEQLILGIAMQLQTVAESLEVGEGDDLEQKEAELQKEVSLSRELGCLLFVAEKDPEYAASCLNPEEFEASIDKILDTLEEVFEESIERIEAHTQLHKLTGIQNNEEAQYHKMTVEMADMLLLNSGSLNVGLISSVRHYLLPQKFESTRAAENMLNILEQLEFVPEIAELINKVEKPVSPELPSNETIRVCLGLSPTEEITDRHAKIVLLSAVLGHLRQARAGTCFTTAWLIQRMATRLGFAIQELSECLTEGSLTTRTFGEVRQYPFKARTTSEDLTTRLSVKASGHLASVLPYGSDRRVRPARNAYLWDAPGINQACIALGFDDPKEVLLSVLRPNGNSQFTVNELLIELATAAQGRFHTPHYNLRSGAALSVEELTHKAQYAFGSQGNHPLHRAWEQSIASMPNYFASRHLMPSWVFETVETCLQDTFKKQNLDFQVQLSQLIGAMYLPMVSRMRYRYNQHIENTVHTLFDDGNLGTSNSHSYGYELCDTGLPKDFQYSDIPYHNRKSGNLTTESIEQVADYAPGHKWKDVNTQDKFQGFLVDVLTETIKEIKKGLTGHDKRLQAQNWDAVAAKVCEKLQSPKFAYDTAANLFGGAGGHSGEWRKNEHTAVSTPWRFAWGGDPDAIIKAIYSFEALPLKTRKYAGSPAEVLAWHINYIRKQPESVKEEMSDPDFQTQIVAPGHAFLFKPNEEAFRAACDSELDAYQYVTQNLKDPVIDIAESVISKRARNQLTDYLAKNEWVTRSSEKDDLDRQELSDCAKQHFDTAMVSYHFDRTKSVKTFVETVYQTIIHSREKDPKVGKKYPHWNQRFKRVLKNKAKEFFPDISDSACITRQGYRDLLSFARDRKDSVGFSDIAAEQFREAIAQVADDLSVMDFRKEVVRIASQIHDQELGGRDLSWKKSLIPTVDNKIFSLLPKHQQNKIKRTAIHAHDTNWNDGIHDLYFAFILNPCSGEVEMCRKNLDTGKVHFLNQESWFHSGGMKWTLPDNYRVLAGQPLFNVRKYMGI